MIESLKKLSSGDLITIDNEKSKDMSGQEDFEITDIRSFTTEDGECIIITLEDYVLISHTLHGDEKYFFYEIDDSIFDAIYEDDEELPTEISILDEHETGEDDETVFFMTEESPYTIINEDTKEEI